MLVIELDQQDLVCTSNPDIENIEVLNDAGDTPFDAKQRSHIWDD